MTCGASKHIVEKLQLQHELMDELQTMCIDLHAESMQSWNAVLPHTVGIVLLQGSFVEQI